MRMLTRQKYDEPTGVTASRNDDDFGRETRIAKAFDGTSIRALRNQQIEMIDVIAAKLSYDCRREQLYL